MKNRFLDDWLNPVLVKEIRQYFHNSYFLIVMGLLLISQLLLLLFVQFQIANHNLDDDAGQMMFTLIAVGMGLASFAIAAVGSLNRFTRERASRELDFSYLTTLSPARILWGKQLGAAIMIVFIYALCLPFMVIAYFLRGIDMVLMLTVVTMMFLPTLLLTQLGILMGTAGKRFMIALFFVVIFFGFFFLGGFIPFVVMALMYGSRSAVNGGLWMPYVFNAMGIGLLFAVNVAAMSPRFANRMRPVRIYLLAVVALGPLPVILLGASWSDYPVLLAGFGGVMAAVAASLAAMERSEAGPRILRSCPRNLFGRLGYFIISSGSGGGMLLAWSLLAVIAAVNLLTGNGDENAFLIFLYLGFYGVFYGGVAMGVSSRFNRSRPWLNWIYTVILFVAVPLFLIFIIFSTGNYRRFEAMYLLPTTPFSLVGLMDSDYEWIKMIVPALALLGVMLSMRSVIGQFRRFRNPGNSSVSKLQEE